MTLPLPDRTPAEIRPMPLLSDRTFERIRHDIISCVLAPGTEIPEAQLCSQCRIGKAPVRMAVNRLARDGLVSATSNARLADAIEQLLVRSDRFLGGPR